MSQNVISTNKCDLPRRSYRFSMWEHYNSVLLRISPHEHWLSGRRVFRIKNINVKFTLKNLYEFYNRFLTLGAIFFQNSYFQYCTVVHSVGNRIFCLPPPSSLRENLKRLGETSRKNLSISHIILYTIIIFVGTRATTFVLVGYDHFVPRVRATRAIANRWYLHSD